MLLFASLADQAFSLKPGGPYLLDQASCLALGHSLFILLLGDFLLLDIPRVGNTVNGPVGKEPGELVLGQTPPRAGSQQPEFTHRVKLVMKAVLGSSTSKETSLAASARLTALVVTML